MSRNRPYTIIFDELSSGDVGVVGGKNASLGEMTRKLRGAGIVVPPGFATTTRAYREFLEDNDLADRIASRIRRLKEGELSLEEAGRSIRRLFSDAVLSPAIREPILEAYRELGRGTGVKNPSVAVRSSATAEDLPEASFAGQQETYLNVSGEENLLVACRRCFRSLFTDRAIIYRENHGFDHLKVALSVGVQKMVRSDLAGAGVMFSIDTETGFGDVVLINGSWGLGETVVQGSVDPDEYMVFKPLLDGEHRPIIEKHLGRKGRKMVYSSKGKQPTALEKTSAKERRSYVLDDGEILQLARWAVDIEKHYGRPMDMEWAKDGESGSLFIVQARPETVQSRKKTAHLKSYTLQKKGRRLVTGLSVGQAIATGKVCKLKSAAEIEKFEKDAVLVTSMTDPDWVPIMKKAAAIVTDHGGRTSHAAIVSRELGLPAVVGTGNATEVLEDGREVTVSCAEGDQGFVYEGLSEYEVADISLDRIPETRTEIMINIANPSAALRWWPLPTAGVGLARMEFMINNVIRVHPMALIHPEKVKNEADRRKIEELTRGFDEMPSYFVDTLARGVGMIAASQYPRPVIVRMSDFKTNEYAELLGGSYFEPEEANPMLGWRGASRYYSEQYREGFALECRAIRKVREEMGFGNVLIMIPFCRTLGEADRVLETLTDNGLSRGSNGLAVYVMCEIPSNIVLAEDFAERFDGFSIGSNDLTQLTLGVDRDSDRLSGLFDEEDEAVKRLIAQVIAAAHHKRAKVGLCGQAPSDRPAFGRFLVACGIDSISVSPDSFLLVKEQVAAAEREGLRRRRAGKGWARMTEKPPAAAFNR